MRRDAGPLDDARAEQAEHIGREHEGEQRREKAEAACGGQDQPATHQAQNWK